jgi:hypothetical protein
MIVAPNVHGAGEHVAPRALRYRYVLGEELPDGEENAM